MHRAVSRKMVVLLAASLVIAGAIVYSSTVIASGMARTTTETSTSTVTSTLVSTVPTTVTVTQNISDASNQSTSTAEVTVSGTLIVPSGQGAATLRVTVKDGASAPITSIVMGSDSNLELSYNGSAYAPGIGFTVFSGSLPAGQSASAMVSIGAGVTAKDSYLFTVIVSFAGGIATQTQTFSVTAQV